MKKTSIIVALVLIGLALSLYLLQPVELCFYHQDEAFEIEEAGSLKILVEQVTKERIEELVIVSHNNRCYVVDESIFEQLSVVERWGKWSLVNEKKNVLLPKLTHVYLKSPLEDYGVYHLNSTDHISFSSTYDLLLESIEFSNIESSDYKTGNLNKPLEMRIENIEADSVLLIYSSGEEKWHTITNGNTFYTKELHIDKNNVESRVLKAVWENPPENSAAMIYDLLMNSLSEDKVLAMFIDGLGYKLWHYAKEHGHTSTFPDIEIAPMRAAYPPRTIFNYYMFGTGTRRQSSNPNERIIFPTLGKGDRREIIIEGEMQVYKSPIKQKLHPREDRDQPLDESIFQTVLKHIDEQDFLFVHFHDIDDFGHTYGPYSPQVMEAIHKTGYYVDEIVKRWDGYIYLFSDHGMHQVYRDDSGEIYGTHYTGKAEDIISVFSDLTKHNQGEHDDQ